MRAVVRSLVSYDVEDLDSWVPESEAWSIGIRILAGPDGGPGEDSFDLEVCSVRWLASSVRSDGVVSGRHRVFVGSFDWPTIKSYIERRVQQCEGNEWDEVAEKLARLAYWEFEDYPQDA